MPTEERYITFDIDEIMDAVRIGCTREHQPLPPDGTVTEIESREQGENGRVILHIQDDEQEHIKNRIAYTLQFFAISLVFYCQGKGIPIPKAGTKTLKVMPDKIIMKIEI